MVRRQAMAQILWFPTVNPDEGVMTSVYLASAGWKIVYVPEIVQWGLVAETARKHVRQRIRWTANYVHIVSTLWKERNQGPATWRDRIGAATVLLLVIFTNIITAFSSVAVPWILLNGSPTVVYQSLAELRRLLLLETLSFIAAFSAGLARSRAGRGNGTVFLNVVQVGIAPIQIITILETTFSEVFGTKTRSSAPLATIKSSQTPVWARTLTQFFDYDLFSTAIILSLQVSAGYIGWRKVSAASDATWLHEMLSKGGYPAVFLLWFKFIHQTATRIPHLLSGQPLCSSPASLLTPDEDRGVLYPSDRAKDADRTRPAQTFAIVAALYHCVVLASLWL